MIRWIKSNFMVKELLAIFGLFILFCILSSTSNYRNYSEEAKRTELNNMSGILQVLNNNFEVAIQDIDYITALLSNKVKTNMSSSIVDYLTMEKDEDAILIQTKRDIQEYLSSMCSHKTYLQGMSIYGFNERSVSFGIAMTSSELAVQEWYQELSNKEFDLTYLPPHYTTSTRRMPKSSEVFSLIRPIEHKGQNIGIVVADIKSSILDDMFNINSTNGHNIYVVNLKTDEIIYQPEKGMESIIYEALRQDMSTGEEITFSEGNEDYLAVYETSSYTPWTAVGTVKEKDIISGFSLVNDKMLWWLGIYGALFVVLAFVSTYFIAKDLRVLTGAVANISSENMELGVEIKSNDEIGILYQQIRGMILRMKELIRNIKNTEKEKRKSEIKMLEAQINPHFLYNTLNTIKFLASMQGIQNIQKVCIALSDILHINLDQRKFIRLSEEMDYLLNYLQIQEYRYASKISYKISVEEEVRDYFIPKLLLQPIVENSLKYGIAPIEGQGILQINVYQEESFIKVIVRDNGGRFDHRLLKDNQYNAVGTNHIGLYNIIARLELLFGDSSTLRIYSEPGLYTLVEITLPLISEEKQKNYD